MGQRTGSPVLRLIAILTVFCVCLGAKAQSHDSQKYYQIRSMETGGWNFSPGAYYYVMHQKYSGGEIYWSWRLDKLGMNFRFKESKSDCKTIAPRRVTSAAIEYTTIANIQAQIDSVQPLVVEESVRAAERNIDIVYSRYKEDFQTLGENITESILYAMEKSKGSLKEMCDNLQLEYDVICSSIEYIHQQGYGHEIEPTKRQLAYEEAKERLGDLAKASFDLAYYASTLENLEKLKK